MEKLLHLRTVLDLLFHISNSLPEEKKHSNDIFLKVFNSLIRKKGVHFSDSFYTYSMSIPDNTYIAKTLYNLKVTK
jgi:hypothetical protein